MSIEHFISQQRDAFDTESPSAAVWESIDQELTKASSSGGSTPTGWRVLRGGKLARIAAAVTLLLVGIGVGYKMGTGAPQQTSSADLEIASVSPEHAEAVSFFQRDIHAKKEKLAKFANHSSEVESDLTRLEQVMDELRNELKHIPPAQRETVIMAMIENYKTRANLLERVLKHLESQKNKQQKNEPNEI